MAVNGSHDADAEGASASALLAGAERAARHAPARLATITADLFLEDEARLSDLQRATMTQLLAKLVAAVEDDLRQRLLVALSPDADPALLASLAAGRLAIAAPILDNAGLLHDRELVAVLLRRADEHRLVTALHLAALSEDEATRAPEPPLFDELLQAGDPALAGAAMALLIAESRRFDRFQDPLLARTDLPAELQHRLVWWVTAALQHYVARHSALDPAAADRALVTAATRALSAYDEGETLEGRAMTVARRLDEGGLLGDRLIVRALREGRLALAVAGIAVRAAIDFTAGWDMLTDPDGASRAVLLRAIDMERAAAADMLLRLAQADHRSDAEHLVTWQVAAYEPLDPRRAETAIRLWRLDGSYRRALADVAGGLAATR